jgi:arylsulfatase A-like enzyme
MQSHLFHTTIYLLAVATFPVVVSAETPQMDRPPNVIVVMIDALRPDHIGAWGRESALADSLGSSHAVRANSAVQAKTPNLDRIASEGVFFRNIFAPMPSSSPARASILTGRAPHTHGVRINARSLPPEEISLVEILRDAGYTTVSAGPLRRGRDQGFDVIGLRTESDEADSLEDVMWDVAEYEGGGTSASESVRESIRWLQAHHDDAVPLFLWLDLPESLHESWHPPAPYDTLYDPGYKGRYVGGNPMYSPDMTEAELRQANALYDGQLTYVDAQVGPLFDAIDRLGMADNTILVLLSDHGTYIGEHSMWQKCPIMLDPVMRATLMIRYPGTIPAGVQTAHLAQLSDVFATLLDLTELPQPVRSVGESRSLRPTWDSDEPVRDAVFMEFCVYKGTASKAVRTPEWLYVYFRSIGELPWGNISPADVMRAQGWGNRMLFSVPDDPGFARDLASDRPDVVGQMDAKLLDWLIDSENDVPRE